MMMKPFYLKYPVIAKNETRCVILNDNSNNNLPAGKFCFSESFCTDDFCDCRRVFINIIHQNEIVATIGYGWDSIEFYKKWSKEESTDILDMIKGPILEIGAIQSKYSDELLKLFNDVILKDNVFIERLKNHYHLFKSKRKKIGRNAPCPSGSEKKYKKCCLVL